MDTVIDYEQHRKVKRPQRWGHRHLAELLGSYCDLHAQGLFQRQVAKALGVLRTTLQAWHAWQVGSMRAFMSSRFFKSVPGLAFLHRLVLALHVVFVEIGACGMRLLCLVLEMTGLNRFVGASFGTQQKINQDVEEAMVAYHYKETERLAQTMTSTRRRGTRFRCCEAKSGRAGDQCPFQHHHTGHLPVELQWSHVLPNVETAHGQKPHITAFAWLLARGSRHCRCRVACCFCVFNLSPCNY